MNIVRDDLNRGSLVNMIATVHSYPSKAQPNVTPFVHKNINMMVNHGVDVSVLAPQPWPFGNRSVKQDWISGTEELQGIEVRRPGYISFSCKKLFGRYSTYPLTVRAFVGASQRVAISLEQKPDIVYGHFLYPGGLAANSLAEKFRVPSTVVLGESSFSLYEEHIGIERIKNDLSKFSKIISVSELNKSICVERYGTDPNKIAVFPNGIDSCKFYPRDRLVSRESLGLPMDRTILIFVGAFVDRKGPLRVMDAIKDKPDIGVVFLGNGPELPKGSQVIFRGPVSNEDVPIWLSAADIFVLPTLAEGSCNAIIEAMACGLPIISSDRPFNREIVDSSCGLLVDPRDIGELGYAISSLVHDETKRNIMASNALIKSKVFDLSVRVKDMIDWIRLECL